MGSGVSLSIFRSSVAVRARAEPPRSSTGVHAQALARWSTPRCRPGLRLGDFLDGANQSIAARPMVDPAIAGRYRLLERCAAERWRDPRRRIPGGTNLRDQLWSGLRRPLGAAAGKSGV